MTDFPRFERPKILTREEVDVKLEPVSSDPELTVSKTETVEPRPHILTQDLHGLPNTDTKWEPRPSYLDAPFEIEKMPSIENMVFDMQKLMNACNRMLAAMRVKLEVKDAEIAELKGLGKIGNDLINESLDGSKLSNARKDLEIAVLKVELEDVRRYFGNYTRELEDQVDETCAETVELKAEIAELKAELKDANNDLDRLMGVAFDVEDLQAQAQLLAERLADKAMDLPCIEENWECPKKTCSNLEPGDRGCCDMAHRGPGYKSCWLDWAAQRATAGEMQ